MYSVDWIVKHVTIPLSDLTFVSGNSYSLDTADVHKELRRLEWAPEDGLWAEHILIHYPTVTISGIPKTRTIEMTNQYTWGIDASNIIVSIVGVDSNLFDKFLPENGVSILGNNSVGKITVVSGSGVTEQDKIDIIQGTLTADTVLMTEQDTLGGAITHLKHIDYRLFINTELIDPAVENGSQHNPYASETPAIDYAESHGILNLELLASIDFTRQIKNFHVTSTNIVKVDFQGNSMSGSRFSYLELTGSYLDGLTAQHCSLLGGTLNGYFDNCALSGSFTVPNGGFAFIGSNKAITADLIPPDVSVGDIAGTAILNLMAYVGGVTIKHCNQSTDLVTIELNGGKVIIDETCGPNGSIRLGGHGVVINNGSVVDYQDNVIDPRKLADIPNDVADVIL